MSRVDFYLIAADEAKALLGFTCQLLEKAYTLKHHIYVVVNDLAEADQLNDLLWTFHDISFVPHEMVTEDANNMTPIQIGLINNAPKSGDILLNLTPQMPGEIAGFERIIEVVPNDETKQAEARERYQQYKAQGRQIKTHDLRKNS